MYADSALPLLLLLARSFRFIAFDELLLSTLIDDDEYELTVVVLMVVVGSVVVLLNRADVSDDVDEDDEDEDDEEEDDDEEDSISVELTVNVVVLFGVCCSGLES